MNKVYPILKFNCFENVLKSDSILLFIKYKDLLLLISLFPLKKALILTLK